MPHSISPNTKPNSQTSAKIHLVSFLILHGTLGNPDINWLPWLAGELETLGHKALRPQLPTPDGQNPKEWLKVISESVTKLGGPNENLSIVAHSMSPLAVCQYLASIDTPIRACFFVSGFAQEFPIVEPYFTLNSPFFTFSVDWNKVKANCPHFTCFMGDNDPYVPQSALFDFASKLGVDSIVIPDGGHLSSKSGFTQFTQLLAQIQTL
jgi:uncharacterized protein